METKGTTTPPPPSPIFRIRIFDAIIEVPIKHDKIYDAKTGSMIEPDLSQKPPEHSSSVSPNTTDDHTLNPPATATTNEKEDAIISSSSPSPRASNFKHDFLMLLALLPEQSYSPPPPSPTTSFYLASREPDSPDTDEIDTVREAEEEKNDVKDSRFTIPASRRSEDTGEEDSDSVVSIPSNELGMGYYAHRRENPIVSVA
ncbi:hypothetical protein Daesc_000229 [Daldinia eschscholtzii]|uniref:Uncharacterized protein n=1 Tax=Daldinia eschscholtzii TaxID=292717 RepID=A0AAX6MY72_9PEZI